MGYKSGQYGAMDGSRIPLSGISPLPCLPFAYATSLEILEPCFHSFPAFPYTHAYASAQPFVCFFHKGTHLGKPKVVHPPSDCIGQLLLALLVAPTGKAGKALSGVKKTLNASSNIVDAVSDFGDNLQDNIEEEVGGLTGATDDPTTLKLAKSYAPKKRIGLF